MLKNVTYLQMYNQEISGNAEVHYVVELKNERGLYAATRYGWQLITAPGQVYTVKAASFEQSVSTLGNIVGFNGVKEFEAGKIKEA